MILINSTTKGVLPLPDDFTGQLVIIGSHGRTACPKLQLVRATGGSGCVQGKLGSGVFMRPEYVEHPAGSGIIVKNPDGPEDYNFAWKGRLGDVIGLVSDELEEFIRTSTTDSVQPADPDDWTIMAFAAGQWAKADTVAEAVKKCGGKSLGKTGVIIVPRESGINDMGMIVTPRYARKEGRENFYWINDGEDIKPKSLKDAEAKAQAILAQVRGQA